MPKATPRDPDKPKRAQTAFLFFSREMRPKIIAENPGIAFGEVGKKLGIAWAQLGDDERQNYENMASQDRDRYKEEMKHYTPNPEYKKKTKRKDPNRPKRAMSAYLYFCNAHRDSVKAEFPEKNTREIMKILAQRWQEATDPEKGPFEKQADADRKRYDKCMLLRAKLNIGEIDEEEYQACLQNYSNTSLATTSNDNSTE